MQPTFKCICVYNDVQVPLFRARQKSSVGGVDGIRTAKVAAAAGRGATGFGSVVLYAENFLYCRLYRLNLFQFRSFVKGRELYKKMQTELRWRQRPTHNGERDV